MQPHCQQLIEIFNQLFQTTEQTILVGGGQEPLYLPKTATQPFHQIIFTQDYFSSALHEVAHWCIAGTARRQLMDYGYWYNADGRSADEQQLFEQAEIKPQALEWIFAMTAGTSFHVSADNLNANVQPSVAFKENIRQQVLIYLQQGLPVRARLFQRALLNFYQQDELLLKNKIRNFSL